MVWHGLKCAWLPAPGLCSEPRWGDPAPHQYHATATATQLGLGFFQPQMNLLALEIMATGLSWEHSLQVILFL